MSFGIILILLFYMLLQAISTNFLHFTVKFTEFKGKVHGIILVLQEIMRNIITYKSNDYNCNLRKIRGILG